MDVLLHLPSLVRVYWRLLRDRRVSVWPKLLLVGALCYVVLPIDLLPDFVPFVGQIDDLAVIVLAAKWFLDLCPPQIVREHMDAVTAGHLATTFS